MRNPDRKNLRRLARPVALGAVFLLAVPAAGQLLVGRPIESVEYAGVETLSEDSLNYYLDIEAGKPWDPGRVNERIKDLWERKLIDDISIAAEAQGEGVLVRVTITERPLLVSLEYDGLKKVKRSDIGDMTDRERISVFEGLPLDLGELARLEGAIKKLYEERGFRFAGIHIEVQDAGLGEKRVLITVDEGGRVKIGQVDFEGNEVFSAGRLRRQMEKTKKSNLLTRIRKRDVFNSATVQEDLDKVKGLYRQFGYKDVEVGEPELDVIERKPNAERIEDRKRQLALVIPLEEGPRWKLGEVQVEGAEVLPKELLIRMFKEPKGGWLRSDIIDEGVEQVGELYRNSGYIFADVKMEIVERDDLVADILVTVEENDQFRIGRMEFTGNDRTRDRVLRRQMLLKEGDVFNSGMLRTSLLRLSQLEYYVVNEDDPVEVDYDTDDKQVDITVKGSETGQTEVQFGGGYSELDGFFVQSALRTRNFLGRGETVGVSIQTGRYRDIFDVSYYMPWVKDRPQNFGVQLFNRDTDFDLLIDQRYRSKEAGGILTFGRNFRRWEMLQMSYSNMDIESYQSQTFYFFDNPDQSDDPTSDTFEQAFQFNRRSVTATYQYDSHNSRLEPTQGKRLIASLEYAGGPLGGESFFIRPSLNAAITVPLTRRGLRTVGRANIQVGYIEPFGEDDTGNLRQLFFLDRYLLGGENSLRGFAFRSIWVRDPETGRTLLDRNGFPQGGNKSVVINLEHHTLVNGPFRVVTFFDAGNVYGDDQDVDFNHMRMSAGIELRVNVPILGAPLRFIYATNLNPLDNLGGVDRERFDSFDFSIGTSF
ncbi:MAG: outer membrane protein assembly factor BamA [Acidobacteria bacterium]|nr:outer membrane protein assembly factor BamA [Acidobacteriota bacterium]